MIYRFHCVCMLHSYGREGLKNNINKVLLYWEKMSVILWCNHRHNHAPKKGKARTVYISICVYVYLLKHLYILLVYICLKLCIQQKKHFGIFACWAKKPNYIGSSSTNFRFGFRQFIHMYARTGDISIKSDVCVSGVRDTNTNIKECILEEVD